MKRIKLALLSLILVTTLAALPVAAQPPAPQTTLWQQAVDYVNQWSIVQKIRAFFTGSASSGQPPEQVAQQLLQRAQQLPHLTPLEQKQEVADLTRQSAQVLQGLPADQQQEIQRMAVQFSHLSPQEQQAQAQRLIQQSQEMIKSLPPEQQRQLQQTFSQASTYLHQAQEQQKAQTQPQGGR